jgi:transposase
MYLCYFLIGSEWIVEYYVFMYIDVVPNRNSPPAVLLRESFREGKKIRKRTLANLSHLDPVRVQALRRALRGEFDHLREAEPISGPYFGLLYTLRRLALQLGLVRSLGSSRAGKLGLFLVLARLAHGGSRLSAVRWARQQAVEEVLGLGAFNEDDLYEALDQLAARQEEIEQRLYRDYVSRRGQAPMLFLYDVTSSYLEGAHNELAAYGYNRDGKSGKLQIVVGLLTDQQGEPLAVRVFSGNRQDVSTVSEQIEILKERFQVREVVFVGDRGMLKTPGKQALNEVGLRYITALTDPQIRKLLKQGTLQMGLFEEQICEVQVDGGRYVLRKNEAEPRRAVHRLEDKLAKLEAGVQARNEKVAQSRRCRPQVGLRDAQKWIEQHKLSGFVRVRLEGRLLQLEVDDAARQQALLLAGCYVIETDVPASWLEARAVHDSYRNLAQVEQDFRMLKSALLELRPIFVRKESRTRGHVFSCMLALKISREMRKRLSSQFGTIDEDPHGLTLEDAFEALNRLTLDLYPIEDDILIPRLPRPDEQQARILEALQVYLPSKFNQKPNVARR